MSEFNKITSVDVMNAWEEEFVPSVKKKSGSTKMKFTIDDAICKIQFHSKRDSYFIIVYQFLKKYPPESNHLILFLIGYSENGKKLDEKYFNYDLEILHRYYQKAEEKKQNNETYNPFSIKAYKNYVIYMVLKLHDLYETEDDVLFNVTVVDSREYNPLVKIPSVLRGFLPFKIKEYDIKRAYPTFIDKELGTNFRHIVYDILSKKIFAKYLNAHSSEEYGDYYTTAISELEKVYGTKAYNVLTPERFSEKGRAYRDFSKYEKCYIEKFVVQNNLKNYVRLHDAVFILESQIIKVNVFDIVEFGTKEICRPDKNPNVKELFYFRDEKGKFKTTPALCRDFLVDCGVKRITSLNDKILLTRNKGNVIEFLNTKTDLLSIFREGIIESKINFSAVEDLIASQYKKIISESLPLLDSQKLIYYRDAQFTFALPFKNGLNIMDKQGNIKNQKYDSGIGFFHKQEIQEHDFSYTDEIGDYEKFTNNIGGENSEILKILIGYMAHNYKDPSNSPAIILSDDGADGTRRNGGRGKSLIFVGLKKVLPTMFKGGKEFNPDYDFVFGDLDDGIRLYCIDDVVAGFKYDSLYTNILGGINRQRKGTKAEMLEFENSPKFLITTNWLVPYSVDENSTNRRFIEFKINNHYNSNNTPVDEFGKRFFVDWNSNEWNMFYSFIFKCVKLYFEKGLTKPNYDKDKDNYNVKFSNEIVLNEFVRILNMLLKKQQHFNVTDFYNIYIEYENPLKNDKLFNHKNIRDYIEVWFSYSIKKNDNLKNWDYSKSQKKWVCKNIYQQLGVLDIDCEIIPLESLLLKTD